MSNHPRLSRKHAYKHRNPDARPRCTLRAGRQPPLLCPKAQVNGGDAKLNWYKVECKRAKQDGREPDYRWGENVSHVDVDPPVEGSQCPAADPQPQSAAAAMMHGVSRPTASSWQGGTHHCRTSRLDASSATAICDLSEPRVQDQGQSMES